MGKGEAHSGATREGTVQEKKKRRAAHVCKRDWHFDIFLLVQYSSTYSRHVSFNFLGISREILLSLRGHGKLVTCMFVASKKGLSKVKSPFIHCMFFPFPLILCLCH